MSLEDLENYRFGAQAAQAQIETVNDELRSLAAVSPRAELGRARSTQCQGMGLGPGRGSPSPAPRLVVPPPPRGAAKAVVPGPLCCDSVCCAA
jgi:hypothetical protein